MQTIQQRRQRENRQINERLRTLIAARKTLGGSFTGDLSVDPPYLRQLRQRDGGDDGGRSGGGGGGMGVGSGGMGMGAVGRAYTS